MNTLLQYLTVDGAQPDDALLKDAEELNTWLEENHSGIYAVFAARSEMAWTKKEMVYAADQLLREIRPVSHAIRLIGILANATAALNRLRVLPLPPLFIPAIPSARRRPSNPWKSETPQHIAEARRMLSAHIEILKAQNHKSTCGSILGLLIPSAIFFGGLLHKDALIALVQSLGRSANNTLHADGRPQIELRIAWHNQPDAERRLWSPDTISSLLLLRFRIQIEEEVHAFFAQHATQKEISSQQIESWLWKEVLADFRKHARTRQCAPKSLAAMLQRAEVLYRLDLPPMVVSYMAREYLSNSVRRTTLSRIHNILLPQEEIREEADVSPDELSNNIVESHERERDIDSLEAAWQAPLRRILRQRVHSELVKQLRAFATQSIDAPGKRAAEFAIHLFTGRAASGHRLADSTVRRYLQIIASRLCRLLGDADPKDLAVTTLLSNYLKILEEIGSANLRRVVASALYEFHVFLCSTYGVESIDARELGVGKATASTVDANLITEQEYQTMRKKILSGTSATCDPIFFRAAALVLMLGFRCGMRRGEVLWMRICDLIVDPYTQEITEIIVRPWEMHGLKSLHASRRIPVRILLNKEEREELDWWRTRGLASGKSDDLLFAGLGKEGEVSFEVRTFAIVLDAIRNESGDMALRFHHCRHSAATHLFLRLFLREMTLPESSLPARILAGRVDSSDLDSTDLDSPDIDTLYKSFCGVSGLTRKVMFAISQVIGHSSGEVTLEFYIHCMDSVQAILLSQRVIPSEETMLAAISGLSRSASYAALRKHGREKLVQRLMPPEQSLSLTKKSMVAASANPGDWITSLWDFLYRSGDLRQQMPLEDLALDCGLEASRACALRQRAESLANLSDAQGKQNFPTITHESSHAATCFCPRKPHLQVNRALAEELAATIARVMKKSPKLIQNALELWIKIMQSNQDSLQFETLSQAANARTMRDFFVQMNISYRWVIYGPDASSSAYQLWSKKFHIQNSEAVHFIKMRSKVRSYQVSKVALEPQFTVINPNSDKSASYGNEALRYVLTMAWIYSV